MRPSTAIRLRYPVLTLLVFAAACSPAAPTVPAADPTVPTTASTSTASTSTPSTSTPSAPATSDSAAVATTAVTLPLDTTRPPTSTVPTSTVPTSTVPTSTVPTSTVPTPTVPTSTVPVAAVPASQDTTMAGGSGAAVAATAERVVLEVGHVDLIDVGLVDGRLDVAVGDDATSPATLRAPTDVQIRVRSAARVQVPDRSEYSFLGAPGSDVWLLPQTQDPELVWPGWKTARIDPGSVGGDAVTVALVGAEGPGRVVVYAPDRLGAPELIFDREGRTGNSIQVPVGTHAHANWAFGAEGVYRLTFEVAATSGGSPTSVRATYVVLVGDSTPPVPWASTATPAPALPGGGARPASPAPGSNASGSNDAASRGTGAQGDRTRSGATGGAADPSVRATTGSLARTGSRALPAAALALVGVGLGLLLVAATRTSSTHQTRSNNKRSTT